VVKGKWGDAAGTEEKGSVCGGGQRGGGGARATDKVAQQAAPHARWLIGHTREAVAVPEEDEVLVPLAVAVPAVADAVLLPVSLFLAVAVAVPEEAPDALAVADAVADALALDVQEGCCTHCPTPLQYQQGAHVALELHVAVQVSDAVWQA
jgi:hypothetical protein